jgi:hypothetical protein
MRSRGILALVAALLAKIGYHCAASPYLFLATHSSTPAAYGLPTRVRTLARSRRRTLLRRACMEPGEIQVL